MGAQQNLWHDNIVDNAPLQMCYVIPLYNFPEYNVKRFSFCKHGAIMHIVNQCAFVANIIFAKRLAISDVFAICKDRGTHC